MATFTTRTNPKTGMKETVAAPDPEVMKRKLAEQHKELRDMLEGNTQFHDDPFKKPPPKPEPTTDDTDDSSGIPEYYGF